ncbi:MAG: 30S ribosomal protein S6 [Chloroflexi bacterium]|nr:MAG: 30S ribosomal protein S6 [Chloroflexota bacterium]
MRDYELMYIVRPDLDDEGLRGAMEAVESLVEGQGGEVVKTTSWGKRRLAYEIQNLRDGHYVILQLRLDGGRVGEVDRSLRISDAVFRHLIVQAAPRGAEEEPEVELTAAPAMAEATNGAAGAAEVEDERGEDLGEFEGAGGEEEEEV